jgi:hypothetical protein
MQEMQEDASSVLTQMVDPNLLLPTTGMLLSPCAAYFEYEVLSKTAKP